jgi:heme A synthase
MRARLLRFFKSKTYLNKENAMNLKLTAPKEITWWIAVVLGVVGILVHAGVLSLGVSDFVLVAAAFIILAVATLVKGL